MLKHKNKSIKFFSFFFLGLMLCFVQSFSQNIMEAEELRTTKTFFSLQEAMLQPDSVVKLNLSKKKLKEIPVEVFSFHNLQSLVLNKNSIRIIPAGIAKLKNLQELDMSNNKLTQIPPEIGQLKYLVKLKLNRNEITSIPVAIGENINLEILEMWDNELDTIPDDIRNLVHLKTVELRGILFSDETQRHIRELLPQATIYFSPSCACKQ